MKTLWYNDHKVCDVTPLEYEALCHLLPYWGLRMSEDGEVISGALSTFMLGIHGLSQEKTKELRRLLQHTGIKITTDDHERCDQRFYVDFHENHPMPLALKTPEQQLYYLNPTMKTAAPVQSVIHKGITLKRKDGPLYLAIKPDFKKQANEWISYLVIQSFLRAHFESLSSIPPALFVQCTEKVLKKINGSFADVQFPDKKKRAEPVQEDFPPFPQSNNKDSAPSRLRDESETQSYSKQRVTVPPIRPFSSTGSLITNNSPKPYEPGMLKNRSVQPINPFRTFSSKERPIQPFNTGQGQGNATETSVIRPFHARQDTPRKETEYTNKASRIFRQRRDGK
jgi:hypothetical protein